MRKAWSIPILDQFESKEKYVKLAELWSAIWTHHDHKLIIERKRVPSFEQFYLSQYWSNLFQIKSFAPIRYLSKNPSWSFYSNGYWYMTISGMKHFQNGAHVKYEKMARVRLCRPITHDLGHLDLQHWYKWKGLVEHYPLVLIATL